MTRTIPSLLGTLESALYADDLDKATAFWRDVIGLSPFQTVPGRHVFFRVSDKPHPQVLLVFRAKATRRPPAPDARLPVPPHGASGPGHFCLAASPGALDAWRSHLIASGIAIEADFLWPNGARSIYFRDPAGNSIELADPAIWARPASDHG
ncbi:VOC family protein [Paracoccus salsus]|uniref:VOC family protein n=1 Tax=Paracoccus salsus TaxID=2911061 RepID=UPI001F1D59C1|nr:VOC family protein [Paracoccus salsus]MCF3973162.1 VOC family protein [Paracoccus salsus]